MILFLAAGILFTGCKKTGPSTETTQQETEALAAAQSWLSLLDSGDHAACWDASGKLLQTAMDRDTYITKMTSVMTPFGACKSREVLSKKYKTSLPGAPDGEYVVIQFKTSYEKKSKAVETVTPAKEEDGAWRVSGYYIK